MTLKRELWIVYGIVMLLLTLLGLLSVFFTGQAIVTTLISTVLTLFYLYGLHGYVFGKAHWNRSGWRFMFWLQVVSFSLRALSRMFLPLTNQAIAEYVASLLLSLPLLYAIYKYSSEDSPLWEATVSEANVERVEALLSQQAEISTTVISETDDGELRTVVAISLEEDEYMVRISRGVDEQTESFRNTFSSLASALIFMENNTPARAADFG